jgi:hypothetical protein
VLDPSLGSLPFSVELERLTIQLPAGRKPWSLLVRTVGCVLLVAGMPLLPMLSVWLGASWLPVGVLVWLPLPLAWLAWLWIRRWGRQPPYTLTITSERLSFPGGEVLLEEIERAELVVSDARLVLRTKQGTVMIPGGLQHAEAIWLQEIITQQVRRRRNVLGVTGVVPRQVPEDLERLRGP